MTYHVGQTVECINDDWGAFAEAFASALGVSFPAKGARYIVTGLEDPRTGPFGGFSGRICVHLALSGFSHGIFASCHFRPIVERKTETDISVFKKMLEPKKVTA